MFAASHPGASGLPLRLLFPLFDLRLVEYVWSVPPFPWRSGKHLLREAMRYRLPEAVRVRPKTPLFDPAVASPAANPRYRLALRPEVRRQRLRLLESAPGLGEYVDVGAARALTEAPTPIHAGLLVDAIFDLSQWLNG
jgi:hypothetical protein